VGAGFLLRRCGGQQRGRWRCHPFSSIFFVVDGVAIPFSFLCVGGSVPPCVPPLFLCKFERLVLLFYIYICFHSVRHEQAAMQSLAGPSQLAECRFNSFNITMDNAAKQYG